MECLAACIHRKGITLWLKCGINKLLILGNVKKIIYKE